MLICSSRSKLDLGHFSDGPKNYTVYIYILVKIGDNYEAKFTPGRSKLNAKIMDEAEKWIA